LAAFPISWNPVRIFGAGGMGIYLFDPGDFQAT